MSFRTQYQRKRSRYHCDPATRRTKSEFLAETDINAIISKYRRTGVLPPSARSAAARYGDFSAVPSYHDMFNKVIAAQEMFDGLPAKVRASFGNDPGRFIEATQTEEGQKLMVELGLATKRDNPPPASPKEPSKGSDDPKPPKSSAVGKTAAKTSEGGSEAG